jgi:hypothetical protein|tara:strand:+ start:282 stop:473 length:192 start_codon:yes stop_codon:yes gene_type:complete
MKFESFFALKKEVVDIFKQFLNKISKIFLPLVDLVFSLDSYISIDISAFNSTVLDFNFADSVA